MCEVLGLTDTSKSLERLDDDEKLIRKLFVSGQNRDISTVNEPGLYSLIIRSNKPEARAFKRWVTHEVLPAIRKTGTYTMPGPRKTPLAIARALKAQIMIGRLLNLNQNQAILSANTVVKEEYGYDCMTAHGVTHLASPVQEMDLTPTAIGNRLGGKSAVAVNKMLAELGYQEKIDGAWSPTGLGRPLAVLKDTGKRRSKGTPIQQLFWKESIIDILTRKQVA